jgi:hypothetical protein
MAGAVENDKHAQQKPLWLNSSSCNKHRFPAVALGRRVLLYSTRTKPRLTQPCPSLGRTTAAGGWMIAGAVAIRTLSQWKTVAMHPPWPRLLIDVMERRPPLSFAGASDRTLAGPTLIPLPPHGNVSARLRGASGRLSHLQQNGGMRVAGVSFGLCRA